MKFYKFTIVLILIFIPLKLYTEEPKTQNLELHMGKWIINCSSETEKKCILERSIFLEKEMKNKLVTIVMQKKISSKDVRFTLISPLGLLIQSGVKIGFDGKLISEDAFGFNVCERIGCITSMLVKKETLERFKKSNSLNLEYIRSNGQKIEIKFDLDGFAKEFDKISKIE